MGTTWLSSTHQVKRQDQQLQEAACGTCGGLMAGVAVLSPRIAYSSSPCHWPGATLHAVGLLGAWMKPYFTKTLIFKLVY